MCDGISKQFTLSRRTDGAASPVASMSLATAALSSTISVLQKIHTKVALAECECTELANSVLRKIASPHDQNIVVLQVVGDAAAVMEALGKITTIMSLVSNAKRLTMAQVMDPAEALAAQVYNIRQAAAAGGTSSGSPRAGHYPDPFQTSTPSSPRLSGSPSDDVEVRSLMRQHKYALDEGHLLLARIAAVRERLFDLEEKLLAHFGVTPVAVGNNSSAATGGAATHQWATGGSPSTIRRRQDVSKEQIAEEVAAEMRKDPRYWSKASPSPPRPSEDTFITAANSRSSNVPGATSESPKLSRSRSQWQDELARLETLITSEVALQHKIIHSGSSTSIPSSSNANFTTSAIDLNEERRKVERRLISHEEALASGRSPSVRNDNANKSAATVEEAQPSGSRLTHDAPNDDAADTTEKEAAEQREAYERLRARFQADEEQARLEQEAEAAALAELQREEEAAAEEEENMNTKEQQEDPQLPQSAAPDLDQEMGKHEEDDSEAAAEDEMQRAHEEMKTQVERLRTAAEVERSRADAVAEELEAARAEAAAEQRRLLGELMARERQIAEKEEEISRLQGETSKSLRELLLLQQQQQEQQKQQSIESTEIIQQEHQQSITQQELVAQEPQEAPADAVVLPATDEVSSVPDRMVSSAEPEPPVQSEQLFDTGADHSTHSAIIDEAGQRGESVEHVVEDEVVATEPVVAAADAPPQIDPGTQEADGDCHEEGQKNSQPEKRTDSQNEEEDDEPQPADTQESEH